MLQIDCIKNERVDIHTRYQSVYETDWYYKSKGHNTVLDYLPWFNTVFNMFFNNYGYLESYLIINVLGKTLEINILS